MVQLVVFVVVLAVVYAVKAAVVARTHDDLIVDSASFSWMSARKQDEETAAAWAREEQVKNPEARGLLSASPATMRRVRA